jgi:hypothetical protein
VTVDERAAQLEAAFASVSDEAIAERIAADPESQQWPSIDWDGVEFGVMPPLTAERCEQLDNDEWLDLIDAYRDATEGPRVVTVLRAVTRRFVAAQRRQDVSVLARARINALRAHAARARAREHRPRSRTACSPRRSARRRRRRPADDDVAPPSRHEVAP